MAMTNAQRQARFRIARKSQGHFGSDGKAMERVDAWVSADAAHGLRVLAELQGIGVQEAFDSLILAAIEGVKGGNRAAWSAASLAVLDKQKVTR